MMEGSSSLWVVLKNNVPPIAAAVWVTLNDSRLSRPFGRKHWQLQTVDRRLKIEMLLELDCSRERIHARFFKRLSARGKELKRQSHARIALQSFLIAGQRMIPLPKCRMIR
jgi:hypothetical protein